MMWKLILVGLGLVVGDLLMKNWIISGSSFKNLSLIVYLSALVVYSVSLTTYAYQLRTMNFGIATIVPVLVNVIVVAIISFFYYKEAVSIYQSIGILFAVVAIVLFSK